MFPLDPLPADVIAQEASVLAMAKRVLPADLRRAIAMQSAKAVARHADGLAERVVKEYRLSSRAMLKNLRYVLAVKRCTANAKFVAMGVYERFERHNHPHQHHVIVTSLDYKMHFQQESYLVRSKRPARYVAIVFRATPLHGPWKKGDRRSKVALEPVRSTTAVLGGDTITAARVALYRMTHCLVRTVIPDDVFMCARM